MRDSAAKAFTLIELMVVIGVIALMSGALIVGLKGNDTAGLRSSQSTVSAMLAAARSQAALENREVAVMINYDANNREAYLHGMVLAANTSTGWVQTGDVVTLSDGIYVVPQPAPAGSANFGSAVSSVLTQRTLDGVPQLSVSFTALGRLNGAGGALVLSPGLVQPEGEATPVLFKKPDAVRGLIVSSYGAITSVDEKDGFN